MATTSMDDVLEGLAADIKASVSETCAKVAEIHHIKHPESEWHLGYNQATRDIAAKIRELNNQRAV